MCSLYWSPINRYKVIIALFLGVLSSVSLWGRDINFTPDKPDGPPKIQSALWELATPGAAKPTRDVQDTVVVILVPHLGQASASIDTSSLAALGGRVLAQSKSLMRVSIPAASLLAVSELPGVRFVRRPHRPHAQQETWSEGGWSIKAYDNYFEGVRGQGVKVAIIDVEFKGADELPGEMPARWRYRDYTGEGIYAGEDLDVHGTACAEIIHDMAQEAELTLLKVGDLLDLENAKDLCIREGIDIISHSVGWFGTGIGDGRGTACDIVDDAADKGILWVNSAGNDAQSHYDGFWFDSDDDSWQNFSGEDEVLAFEAEEGEEIRVFLTWNDWPDSRENYDLYLDFVNSSGDLELVAESTDRQNIFGGDPVESIEYTVERAGEYGISVRSEDARPRRLKIWSLNHDFEEYSVAENSIGSPADARGAMSVGAVHYDYYDLGRIADYSSRGPTTDGRFKPELVAPSGVSTVSYGESEEFYGYTGTSAAAPHVAGAAALIKSANPSYSRTQLWDALIEATVDIGPRGRDNDSGYGKLVLPVMQASSIPQITSVSPSRAQPNQTVTIIGSNFGSSRGSSSVWVGSVRVPSFMAWSNTIIRFRVPTNMRSGNVTVRTAEGTSNAVRLEITSGPYLSSISPSRVKPGDLLTLTGSNFGRTRSSSYVLFTPNVWPTASSDYVTWSDTRIVVKVPAGAQSGNVKVVVGSQSSGTKRITVEGEVVESLPSRGLFGYSPPAVTKNPKSVKFGFDEKTNSSIACYFSVKEISDGEITIFFNEQSYSSLPESEDWTHWYLVLDRSYLRSGTNIIEFRNLFNQNRTSGFARWQLKDVWVGEPPSAKPVAGIQLLSKLSDGLGDPFPSPFNAEVTIPFALAEAGPVRLAVYNLLGQQVRVLADGGMAAGAHRVRWDGRTAAGVEAASGVYWVVLQVSDAVQTAKLALIR